MHVSQLTITSRKLVDGRHVGDLQNQAGRTLHYVESDCHTGVVAEMFKQYILTTLRGKRVHVETEIA